MGWDFYCALCGCPFKNFEDTIPSESHQYPEDEGLGDGEIRATMESLAHDCYEEYDNSVLSQQSVAWLRDVRAIGKFKDKVFVSGVGVEWPSGSVSVDPGDDPNVPEMEEVDEPVQPGRLYLEAYSVILGPLENPSFPIHAKCFEILAEVQKHRSRSTGEPAALNLDMVYQGMLKHLPPHRRHLDLNGYGEISLAMDQWWSGSESLEPWLHDPLDIPVVNALDTTRQPRRVRLWARSADSAANCLSDLPAELLVHIADYLDIQSVIRLARSCREINAVLDKNFWRRRFFADMPYLFEIRQKVKEEPEMNVSIDWRDFYGRMRLQSYPGEWDRVWWKFTDPSRKLPHNADLLLGYYGGYGRRGLLKRGDMVSKFDPSLIGIASRRRVWQCAEELLGICEKYALEADEASSDTEPEDSDGEGDSAE